MINPNILGKYTVMLMRISLSSRYEADDLEKNSMALLDHQTQELKSYDSATQRMGQDIIALRAQVRDLENLNSNLRRDLANYNDSSRIMLDSTELEGLTKPEILSQYGQY